LDPESRYIGPILHVYPNTEKDINKKLESVPDVYNEMAHIVTAI
jgi:hypothetical protein